MVTIICIDLVVTVAPELLVILPTTTIVKVVRVVTDVVYQFRTFGLGNVGVNNVGGLILLIEKIKSSIKHWLQLTVNLFRVVWTLVCEEPTLYAND